MLNETGAAKTPHDSAFPGDSHPSASSGWVLGESRAIPDAHGFSATQSDFWFLEIIPTEFRKETLDASSVKT